MGGNLPRSACQEGFKKCRLTIDLDGVIRSGGCLISAMDGEDKQPDSAGSIPCWPGILDLVTTDIRPLITKYLVALKWQNKPELNLKEPYKFVSMFGRSGKDTGRMKNPVGVTVHKHADGRADYLFVLDPKNKRITEYDNFGGHSNTYEAGAYPCALAFNSKGQFVVVDQYSHQIQISEKKKWLAGSAVLARFGQAVLGCPEALAINEIDGNLFVSDSVHHTIQVFSPTGTWLKKFGSHGKDLGELNHPTHLVFDPQNNLLVSDTFNNRIQTFDPSTGQGLRVFGTFGGRYSSGLSSPLGLVVDKHGTICVVDSGNHRLQLFTKDGEYVRSIGHYGHRGGEFNNPAGITMDKKGHLIIADTQNNRIQTLGTFTDQTVLPGLSLGSDQ